MYAIKKISVIAVLFLFLTGAPLWAMEPFYKGEWGMTPAEVAALYNAKPVRNISAANYALMEYTDTIEGYASQVVYNFDADKRLCQVNVIFAPRFTAAADARALLNNLAAMVKPADANDAFIHEDGEFSYPPEGVWNGFHSWQNAADYISLMATITYAETDRAKTKFEFDACDPKNPFNGVYSPEELENIR